MDIRKKKTKQAIRQAFLQLRQGNSLEQITVKELAQLAQISKATFYLHYRDIYDLSEQLQQEVIRSVIDRIASPLSVLTDIRLFMTQMTEAMELEQPQISILFSGTQMSRFPIHLERSLKAYIFGKYPELRHDEILNVQLSYHIQGGYYAYMQHIQTLGEKQVISIISEIYKNIPPIRPFSAPEADAVGTGCGK